MGRKEYERAAEIVREFRANNGDNANMSEIASHIEASFISLFSSLDSKHRFDSMRFTLACRDKK